MRTRVVLFDIDGTLVDCGGSGRTCMRQAFETYCGKPDVLAELRFGGMTDRAIVRYGLEKLGHDASLPSIERVIAMYLELLPSVIAQNPKYRVLAGVNEAVRLAGLSGSAVGLGTGNIKAGAQIKLRRGQLDQLFAFGGFGCDAEDRGELLRQGKDRGLAQLGVTGECDTLIVGDTPRDVVAAHAIGARCLAVATGGHSAEELDRAGADWTTESLETPLAREVLAG